MASRAGQACPLAAALQVCVHERKAGSPIETASGKNVTSIKAAKGREQCGTAVAIDRCVLRMITVWPGSAARNMSRGENDQPNGS